MSGHTVGVDVGGTHLRAAIVDERGALLRVERQTLVGREPQALLEQMANACTALGQEAVGLPMAVGLAAQIWLESGTVAVAPNLGWRDVPFGAMLSQRFGMQVRMVNDLNAIAVGEARCGAGERVADVACVFVGTGVGMGAVVGGEVVEGADGLATELGHIKVDAADAGRACGCGERGCLEAYTSGRHLPDLLAGKAAAGLPSPLLASVDGRLGELTAGKIDAQVGQDAAAAALWTDIADLLGRAVGNVVTLFNPRVLVLGGGVLAAAPTLRRRVEASVRRYAARPAQSKLLIRDSALGDDAGIIGAALLAHRGT